jgi:hypothetical protein
VRAMSVETLLLANVIASALAAWRLWALKLS